MSTIAFDGSCLAAGSLTGVERSFLLTLAAFARRGDRRCLLWLPAGARIPLPPGVEARAVPRLPLAVWRQWLLPRELLRARADCLLSPTTALPDQSPCPAIATVHELPELYPAAEDGALRGLRQQEARVRLATRAALVLVPSRHTARDLWRTQPELRARTRIVPQPLDPCFLEDTRVAGEARGFVFVGAGRRRKNLPRLFVAYAALPMSLRARHPLRWVGGAANEHTKDLKAGVELWPELPTRELARLMRGSLAVLLPSLSEGFGLPALEAAAVGRPVLASQGSVTEELCPETCVAVDPYDQDALRAGLVRLVDDETLRARAAAVGPARARAFTPERTAAGWEDAIREVHTARSHA
jgi:alpha-1,3-rhamnosyl/mannosyltransferase